MELRTLHYFLVAARTGNITKAAVMLHISQPSLSRAVMQLEEELGVKLLKRTKHHVELTEDGVLFAQRAEEIISLSQKAKDEMHHGENTVSGQISIGCAETKNVKVLAEIMAKFREKYPEVTFYVYTGVEGDIKNKIESGILDFGMVMEPAGIGNYYYIRMPITEFWSVLMKKSHPLADKEEIVPADLADERLILSKPSPIVNVIQNWFGEYYKDLDVITTTSLSYYTRSLMVETGLGLAVLGDFENHNPQLCLKRLTPEIKMSSVLIWHKDKPISRASAEFAEFLKMQLMNI